MQTTNTSGFSSGASIPDASIFSTKLSDNASIEGKSPKNQSSGPTDNRSKRGFPFWLLIFLLLLFTTGISARSQKLLNAAQILTPGVGIDEIASSGTSGLNGVDGINGEKGANGNDGRPGTTGEKGQDGAVGSKGADGVAGAAGAPGADGVDGIDGADGAQGVPGSNDCINGICVSRQSTSPGTQENGNINIDGAVLAASLTTSGNTTFGDAAGDLVTSNAASWSFANASAFNIANSSTTALNIESGLLDLDTSNSRVGIGTTSPANTLSVAGTANVSGHSAFGSGATVNGITSASDAVSGISAHNTIGATYETLTSMNSATTMYEALGGVLKLNPSSAPSYGQVAGNNGGVEIVSGNAQNFTGNITGMNGSVIHAGTGAVTSAVGNQGVLLNQSNGNVANGYGLRALGLNYNTGATPCVTNVTCLITNYVGVDSSFAVNLGTITNYKGIQIQTPINAGAGTITNNVGLHIKDQSSVGSTSSYNLYSEGATAKNYFAGKVGIGNLNPDANLEITSLATDANAQTIIANNLTSGTGLAVFSSATAFSGDLGKFEASGNDAGVTGHSLKVGMTGASSTGTALTVTNAGTGNVAYFNDDGTYGDTTPFVITSTGAVGIGKATPTDKLQVDGAIRAGKVFFRNVDNNDVYSYIMYDGADNMKYAAYDAHTFFTESGSGLTQRMIIDGNGNVGIGQDTPSFKLDVNGTSRLAGDVNLGASAYTQRIIDIGASGTNSTNLILRATDNSSNKEGAWLQMGAHHGFGPAFAFYYGSNADASADRTYYKIVQQASGGDTTRFVLDNSGNLGVGDSTPDARFDVSDTGTAGSVFQTQNSAGTCDHTPGAGSETVSCSSDERLKTNITDAASVLSEIKGLKIHDYTVIASGQETTGLIAQEVINTNPEMVHMGEDGYYKVDSYNPWKVLKGIQELSSSQDNLLMQLTNAIDKTSGDIDATNKLLANQGLRIDQLSATLDAYASQLSDHQTRIEILEAEIRALKQQ